MGSVCSLYSKVDITDNKQIKYFLSPEEVKLVKSSWKLFNKKKKPDIGFRIFFRINLNTGETRNEKRLKNCIAFLEGQIGDLNEFFEMHPELKKLFKKQMMMDDDDLIVDEDKLRNHGNIVMEGLGAAVESLDDSVFLSNVLVSMGESHAQHNVKPEMVILLWPAIREAFSETIGPEFTPDVNKAWEHIFEYMSTKFKEGLRHESRNSKYN